MCESSANRRLAPLSLSRHSRAASDGQTTQLNSFASANFRWPAIGAQAEALTEAEAERSLCKQTGRPLERPPPVALHRRRCWTTTLSLGFPDRDEVDEINWLPLALVARMQRAPSANRIGKSATISPVMQSMGLSRSASSSADNVCPIVCAQIRAHRGRQAKSIRSPGRE